MAWWYVERNAAKSPYSKGNEMRKILILLSIAGAIFGGNGVSAMDIDVKNFGSDSPKMVAKPVFAKHDGALEIALPSADSLGYWNGTVPVKPGVRYRVSLDAEGAGAFKDRGNVAVIITWQKNEAFTSMLQRDYLDPVAEKDGTIHFERTLTAPAAANFLEIRCIAKWEPGKVAFRNLKLEEVALQGPRPVRVVSVKVYSPTRAQGLASATEVLDKVAKEVKNIDVVLLPECFADRCGEKGLGSCGEKLPGGPTFDLLSKYAKALNCYVVASIHEDDNGRLYNTAVILDREGKLFGKFRKVHLPTTEMEAGVLPGSEYPVFDFDFGKVGILICWDNWFVEAARILRINGAELLLFPLAGNGDPVSLEHTWTARAMDNGLPMVVSSFLPDNPARIILPDGKVVAECKGDKSYITSEIDLNKHYRTFWLSVGAAEGEGRSLYLRERRESTYNDLNKKK